MNNEDISRLVRLLSREAEGDSGLHIMITLNAGSAIVRSTDRERDEGGGIYLTLTELAEALNRFEAL